MKYIITITITILVLTVGFANAAKAKKEIDKPYPTGCEAVGFSYKYGVLLLKSNTESTPQSIFFLHNISKKAIEFYQVRDGSHPYIMHSHNTLGPDQWAAYATDQSETKFICTTASKTKYQGGILDCEKSLKICQYPKVKFALNNRGNYWATTNQTKNSAVKTVIRQGTLLRWW